MDNKKESADMLEHARQISEDADLIGEQITLTKKQQYCVAKHLQGFRILEIGSKKFTSCCVLCKYVPFCQVSCRDEIFDLFSKQTGVKLSLSNPIKIESLPDYLLEDSY